MAAGTVVAVRVVVVVVVANGELTLGSGTGEVNEVTVVRGRVVEIVGSAERGVVFATAVAVAKPAAASTTTAPTLFTPE